MTVASDADTDFDAAIAAMAVPVVCRRLVSRPSWVWVAWLIALGVVVSTAVLAAVLTTQRAITTSSGPATAHCGLDVYIYGAPEPAAASACRHLEAGRGVVFVVAALIAIGGLIVWAWRTGRLEVVGRAPVRAAVIGAGAAGFVVGLLALRPAAAELSRAGSVSTVHCGLDTYLSGYPDPAIDHLCRHAYAPHAHVLFVALGALVLGLIAAAHLWRWSWRGVAYGLLGVLVVAVAVDALRPVRVGVGGGAIASCGLDSYVAGYPDHTVQVACGAHLSTHALGLLAAALVAVVGLIAVRMIGSPLLGSGRRHEA